jgi:hypothetical protein
MKKKNKDITKVEARRARLHAISYASPIWFGPKFVETFTRDGKRHRIVRQCKYDFGTPLGVTTIGPARVMGPKFA